MKRKSLCAIGIGVAVGIGAAQAYAGETEGKCTLATLNGQYLFNGSGTLFPPAFGVTSVSTGTSAGFHIFNGDGRGTGFVTFSVNGIVEVSSSSSPITYTLNSDCTGTYQVPGTPALHFDIFVAVDGSALTVIETDPGVALSWGPQPRVGSPQNAQ
jgi:ABC-type phosphate transport system substrate-binding protein